MEENLEQINSKIEARRAFIEPVPSIEFSTVGRARGGTTLCGSRSAQPYRMIRAFTVAGLAALVEGHGAVVKPP